MVRVMYNNRLRNMEIPENLFSNLGEMKVKPLNINKDTSDKKIELLKEMEKFEVEKFDSFIRIFCNQGDYINNIVPEDITVKIGDALKEYRDIRVNEKKWVLLNYPSLVDSNKAKMNPDKFFNFSFVIIRYLLYHYHQQSLMII